MAHLFGSAFLVYVEPKLFFFFAPENSGVQPLPPTTLRDTFETATANAPATAVDIAAYDANASARGVCLSWGKGSGKAFDIRHMEASGGDGQAVADRAAVDGVELPVGQDEACVGTAEVGLPVDKGKALLGAAGAGLPLGEGDAHVGAAEVGLPFGEGDTRVGTAEVGLPLGEGDMHRDPFWVGLPLGKGWIIFLEETPYLAQVAKTPTSKEKK